MASTTIFIIEKFVYGYNWYNKKVSIYILIQFVTLLKRIKGKKRTYIYTHIVFVHVSLTQLVWTMHKICKVRGSNLDHHQKKYSYRVCYTFILIFKFPLIYLLDVLFVPKVKGNFGKRKGQLKRAERGCFLYIQYRKQIQISCLLHDIFCMVLQKILCLLHFF